MQKIFIFIRGRGKFYFLTGGGYISQEGVGGGVKGGLEDDFINISKNQ